MTDPRPTSGADPSAEERARAARVDAMLAAGEESIPALIEMLADRSWTVRRAVVAALAALGDAAVGPLCECLRTRREDEARIAANVDALVASTGADVDAMVSALATDASPAVVSDAAQILGRRRSRGAVPLLAELTRHADDNVAVSAIEALGRVGGRAAVTSLEDMVRSGNFFRTFPAIDVLGRSGDPRAVEALVALLGQPMYALEATRALGRTGDRGAVAPLARLLNHTADATVRVAALAISELFDRHADRFADAVAVEHALAAGADRLAVRRLGQALTGADAAESIAVARVLGVLGGEAAVVTLTRLLDGTPAVAAAAAEALWKIGERSNVQLAENLLHGDSARRLVLLPLMNRAAALDAVIACLSDTDADVRAAACDAIGRIGSPVAVPALMQLLADANPRVTQSAVAAVQALGGLETERLALEAGRSPNANVRRAALRILSYFGFASSLPLFFEAVADQDPRVRDAAIQGLPFLDDPAALERLFELARDSNARIRAAAMRALGQCRGELRVAAFLLKGMQDGDPWVRYYACQSLGRLGVETAASAIAALLDDEAGQVRVAAIESLSHLRGELAFAALRRAAEVQDLDMRRAALVGLGISRRPEALPILLAAAASTDVATRLVAVSAMADLEADEVSAQLGKSARDADEGVRNAAIGYLAARAGVAAARALAGLLVDTHDRERVLAALAVAVDGRVDAIVDLLRDADDEIAPDLLAALSRMRRPDADAALLRALALPNVAARKAAAAAVAALGTRDALTAVKRASVEDPDPEVRRIASLLLAQ